MCAAALGNPVYAEPPGQGTLTILDQRGEAVKSCPLEHTSVQVDVSGFVAKVSVRQVFRNPQNAKIEAVYTFPLSSEGAVDSMTMRIGERLIKGEVKRREEARAVYEAAKASGNVASLLDQERPNIFTQAVANIMPGEKVEIEIQYSEVLAYADGAFKFAFPMVVGPRFIPGSPTEKQGSGWSPDTTKVPDASLITPPVAAAGTRAGHDIDLTLKLNAGIPIQSIKSELHEIEVQRDGADRAVVSLKNKGEVPNRDFVLSYTVAGDEVRSGILSHKDGKNGYVTIIMIPPKRITPDRISPKEMIFVIDCSGSQAGKPLEKAKDTMRYIIDHMNPDDTFNIVDFNSGARVLFEEARKNTKDNRAKALRYLSDLQARGGTWMGPAVETICNIPAPKNRLRIVTFMTDGYVGNDFEIISLVKKYRNTSRWFPFGTGNSVNRFLLDQMARVGGGEPEYILLNSSGEEIAKKFYERIASPVLTDISLQQEGVALQDVFPESVIDLWSHKPLIFKARYNSPGKGTITIKGLAGGKPYTQTLHVELPEKETGNSSLGSLWARAKVDDLMSRDWLNVQQHSPDKGIKEEIVRVALEHQIMTQFTSFVAVEEATVTIGGQPTRVVVPVELPDGVSREGIFGEQPSVPASAAAVAYRPTGTASAGIAKQGTPVFRRLEADTRALEKKEDRRMSDETSRNHEPPLKEKSNAKLDPALAELIDFLKEHGKESLGTYKKVVLENGKIAVLVWLRENSETILDNLKTTGLQIHFVSAGKAVIGSISVENLEQLAALAVVKRIEQAKTAAGISSGDRSGGL
jgi:Ca-activated chloride channel family protein